jgi:hypothetical protein
MGFGGQQKKKGPQYLFGKEMTFLRRCALNLIEHTFSIGKILSELARINIVQLEDKPSINIVQLEIGRAKYINPSRSTNGEVKHIRSLNKFQSRGRRDGAAPPPN